MSATVQAFFDPFTCTLTYVVYECEKSSCAIIDSVLDYDPKAGRISTTSANKVIDFVRSKNLQVEWILETHAHADHLSASSYLKKHLGGKVAVGEMIKVVQSTFKKIFNLEPAFQANGSQFDHLFKEDEIFAIGDLKGKALYVPGHTPADMAYQIEGNVFVGDTLFLPDVGTARCDFPGGDAHTLYQSIQKLLDLPEETHLFVCHDYPPNNRPVQWETTVAEQRAKNIHVHDGITEDQFAKIRTKRDATLAMPTLIMPAIQINIRAGEMPPAESNGTIYFKIPVNVM